MCSSFSDVLGTMVGVAGPVRQLQVSMKTHGA